jgi:hypothetical protein
MLRALQGNILKGHGRPATVNIFFKIDTAKKHNMRATLREIANYHAISAYQQLIETDNFHETGQSGSPFVSLFLSATGYAALGVPVGSTPADPSFKAGMKTAAAGLGDAAVAAWDAPFQGPIDGMVLVGSENDTALRLKRDAIANLLIEGGATIVKEQAGEPFSTGTTTVSSTSDMWLAEASLCCWWKTTMPKPATPESPSGTLKVPLTLR